MYIWIQYELFKNILHNEKCSKTNYIYISSVVKKIVY